MIKMIKALLIPLLLIGSALAQATVDGLTIPRRPSPGAMIYWIPARYAQAKEWHKHHSFEINTAGNSPYIAWTDLLFHYQMTGHKPDCERAYRFVSDPNLIVVKHPDGRQSAASNGARWYGETAILTYDWCYSAFDETQRNNLRTVINGWVTGWMTAAWGNSSMTYSNFFWGYLRNEIEWGIASYNDQPEIAKTFLDDALGPKGRWEAFKKDALGEKSGVGYEGSEYGRYQLYYGLLPFQTAKDYGRDLYAETRFFKDAVFYVIYNTTDSPTQIKGSSQAEYEVFPFCDDQNWTKGGTAVSAVSNGNLGSYYGDFLLVAANLWKSLPLAGYAKQWIANLKPSVERFWESTDNSREEKPVPFDTLALDFYAPGPMMAWSRSAWGGTTLYTRFGGMNQAHSHLDGGAFQIWANGRFGTRETAAYSTLFAGYKGVGTVPAAHTILHNGIVVNGVGESVTPRGPAVMERLESKPAYFYQAVDLTDAYRCSTCEQWNVHPDRNNPAVEHIVRELLFLRPLQTVLVFDRIRTKAASDVKTFTLECEANWTLEDATHERCDNGPETLRVTNLVPAVAARVVDESNCTGCEKNGQYRLELDDPTTNVLSYHVNVIQSRKTHAADVPASMVDSNPADPASGTFMVTIGTTKIVLKKGVTSSGGAVDSVPLRNSVQEETMTDRGPSWVGGS
jgi:hypothetical protein